MEQPDCAVCGKTTTDIGLIEIGNQLDVTCRECAEWYFDTIGE